MWIVRAYFVRIQQLGLLVGTGAGAGGLSGLWSKEGAASRQTRMEKHSKGTAKLPEGVQADPQFKLYLWCPCGVTWNVVPEQLW